MMHGQTILLVEDQPDVRDMIEMSLGDLDYRILTAVDGKAARQVLQSDEAIDLLLTDIVMPNGVCGLEIGKIGKRSTASAIGARGCRRVGLPPRLRETGRPRVWFDFPRKAVPADGPCRHDSRCAQRRQKVSCASRRFGRHRPRTPSAREHLHRRIGAVDAIVASKSGRIVPVKRR